MTACAKAAIQAHATFLRALHPKHETVADKVTRLESLPAWLSAGLCNRSPSASSLKPAAVNSPGDGLVHAVKLEVAARLAPGAALWSSTEHPARLEIVEHGLVERGDVGGRAVGKSIASVVQNRSAFSAASWSRIPPSRP
jgi:hypothetical protein